MTRASRLKTAGKIRLVVSCTKRKKGTVSPDLHLGSVPAGNVTRRSRTWLARVKHQDAVTPVHDLYSGDHWVVACSLAEIADVWVCSAGLGLITDSAMVAPYSATFAPDDPDSVIPEGDCAPAQTKQAWWEALGTWEGPQPGRPRSLAALATEAPHSPILCAASGLYLEALVPDLLKARNQLKTPDLLSIVSAGAQGLGELEENCVPCDARLQTELGGALASLNVRFARRIVQEQDRVPVRASRLQTHWSQVLEGLDQRPAFNRRPMTDDDVRHYITRSLKRDPRKRPTPLLQELRKGGQACEHGRFRELFHSVAEEVLHGS